MGAAIVLAVGGGASGSAAPATVSECGAIKAVAGAKYCYHKLGANPQYTIWFFHGFGDSEWVPKDPIFNDSLFNQDSYKGFQAGLPSVNIVLISYGRSWLLTNYPGRKKDPVNATVETFKSKIVPFIESKYGLARPYVVIGQSMGGFSAATLCAAQPAMWSKCVLVNPMLLSCDPYDFLHCALRNPQDFGTSLLITLNFSEKGWRETQPMALLKKTTSLPQAFVTACKKDDFVEFEGPEEWVNLAKGKNADSRWEPVVTPTCDHFHWPYQRVLDFLAH
jgi:pimeloyl-ACP methyl ester carboxylesterase